MTWEASFAGNGGWSLAKKSKAKAAKKNVPSSKKKKSPLLAVLKKIKKSNLNIPVHAMCGPLGPIPSVATPCPTLLYTTPGCYGC